jgi:hypothetical protein
MNLDQWTTLLNTLQQVRNDGETNMLHQERVAELAEQYDARAAYDIAQFNPAEYMAALNAMGQLDTT